MGHEDGFIIFNRAVRKIGAAMRRDDAKTVTRRLQILPLSEDQNSSAIATAFNKAEALLIVSWYSEAGTESATMPAPAWI